MPSPTSPQTAPGGEAQAAASSRGRWRRVLDAPFGEPFMLIVLALAVGVIGGLGAVVFRLMIRWLQIFFRDLLIGQGLAFLGPERHWAAAIVPALGLICVGVITTYFAREVKGHGVPQILESLALRGGRIRPRVGAFGILAPALTIGSGGSVGREGPIALIGAAFGSTVGQALRLTEKHTSLLVACGAGAGIAATFNAPVAGGLFGLEVVLGSFAMGALVPVFVSAVTAVEVFRHLMGAQLVMPTPAYSFRHPTEVLLALVLGLAAGGVGLAYTRGLELSEDLFDGWRVPFWVKNLTGGLIVGLIGLAFPQVLGVGYGTLQGAVRSGLPELLFFVLLLAKYVATTTTVGAGGSGGVFAPSLYLGVMLGGSYGLLIHLIAPGWSSPAVVYSVVGMGAVFAAAAQAPLTATVIILEMTGDYNLTVGVMAACAIAYLVYGSLARDSMYTVKLTRRGLRILRGAEVRPLQEIAVSSAMSPLNGGSIQGTASIGEAWEAMKAGKRSSLVVIDADGHLAGMVEEVAVFEALAEGRRGEPLPGIVTPSAATAFPDLTLDEAMRRFAIYGTGVLPVVERGPARKVLGLLTRGDAMRAYTTHTVHNVETHARIRQLQGSREDEGAFREFPLTEESPAAGHRLADVELPREAVIVSVVREGQVIVPHGDTVLRPHDRVLIFAAPSEALAAVGRVLGDPSLQQS